MYLYRSYENFRACQKEDLFNYWNTNEMHSIHNPHWIYVCNIHETYQHVHVHNNIEKHKPNQEQYARLHIFCIFFSSILTLGAFLLFFYYYFRSSQTYPHLQLAALSVPPHNSIVLSFYPITDMPMCSRADRHHRPPQCRMHTPHHTAHHCSSWHATHMPPSALNNIQQLC